MFGKEFISYMKRNNYACRYFLKKINKIRHARRRYVFFTLVALVFFVWFIFFSLPNPLFDTPYSTVLLSESGELLGASIATDEQWRFPSLDSLPEKYIQSITYFEDEYFFYHPGVNPVSLARAFIQNISSGTVISGASTITMQVIRLQRNEKRTIYEKLIEMMLAVRLELGYSKDEILILHASQAPYGGNIVGLEAASWRYYGRSPFQLSWAETATLAVLPNSPSLIYPGKNQEKLLAKRNRLLDKLYRNGVIDSVTNYLAKKEVLPGTPKPLPATAPHLLVRAKKEGFEGERIHSGILPVYQGRTNAILDKYNQKYAHNEIYNAAALIVEVRSGKCIAYVGNTFYSGQEGNYGENVDIITSPRSTGSILKPLLYASMLNEGVMTPEKLIPDIPTYLNGFAPKNFDETFDGAVPADEALARSLNIPAVYMLQNYGIPKFHFVLNDLGLTTIKRSSDTYGLSLILGGAEANLWELTSVYSSMARALNHYNQFSGEKRYLIDDYRLNSYASLSGQDPLKGNSKTGKFSAAAIWFTFDAMLDVNRPAEEASWKLFDSSRKIAWKTGTSYGYRDAWAIGVTPEYVIGVWVGNADGEGRPGLTGLSAAAPVLFDLFDILPPTTWFTLPVAEVAEIDICSNSGYRLGKNCPSGYKRIVPKSCLRTEVCPYGKIIHLDQEEKFQVTSDCEPVSDIKQKKFFVLPPVQEWYYRKKRSTYKKIPPFRKGCLPEETQIATMELIYPKPGAKIYIPREIDGEAGETVFEAAHRKQDCTIHWHLDNMYIGSTSHFHQMAVNPGKGLHVLTLVDENGEMIQRTFQILDK